MSPIDPRRVARLEEAVKALHQQVNVLISEVRTLAVQAEAEANVPRAEPLGAAAPPPPPPAARPIPVVPSPRPTVPPRGAPLGGASDEPPPPPAAPPRPRPAFEIAMPNGLSLETLIGRYGILAFAVLLLLMGVGTFISWAISRNYVTPAGRVGLGALAAVAFVAGGFAFRKRGERKFGNVLLSLGLAITHTVAWGAGPKLGIIDPRLALGITAVASMALAALALADEDETLYVVGIGGALLAPFVTSSGRANTVLMLTYGWIVITAGFFAMRGHRWKMATRLMTWAGPIYCGIGLVGATFAEIGDRMAPPFFALACTWSAFALAAEEYKTTLIRAYMSTMAVALLIAAAAIGSEHPLDVAALGVCGTASLYFIQRPLSRRAEDWLIDAVALPLAMLGAALLANGGFDAANGVTITLVWGVTAALAALLNEQERRGPHYMVFGLTTLACLGYLLRHEALSLGFGLVAHAALFVFLMRKERTKLVGVPIGIALITALSQARDVLAVRPAYIGNPFVNPGALLLLVTLLAWWGWFEVLATTRFDEREPDAAWARLSRVFLAIALFCWGWYELGSTVSHDVATALVTLYFAVCGVGAIRYGWARRVPTVRHTGLGLCIVAALFAIARVWNLQSVGIKAGTLIIVSLFFIFVYWLYRGDQE